MRNSMKYPYELISFLVIIDKKDDKKDDKKELVVHN